MFQFLTRGRFAAPLGCALVAGSLSLALLPLAASANTGSITAANTCQGWSAQVQLANNVTADHLVDVVVSPAFGHPGFVGQSFDTTRAAGDTIIWGPFSGTPQVTGTITLVIHNAPAVGGIETTQTQTLTPLTTCAMASPTITTALSTGSVVVPGSVHDSATLAGATADAGGTVTYAVYTDGTCSKGRRDAGTKTVTNGVVPDSSDLSFATAGTYSWQATYSGDSRNNGATSACGTETLVATNASSISGHIYDCTTGTATTVEVPNGTISAAGPATVSAAANPITAPVPPGAYIEHATAPAGYHFVTCGGPATLSSTPPGTADTNVTVPAGGNGNGIFYVAANPTTALLGGHIYDCTGGSSTTTEVTAGTLGATGSTPVPVAANPMAPTSVNSGDYVVTATAPTGYTLVACNHVGTGPQTLGVPPGGNVTAVFYVTKDVPAATPPVDSGTQPVTIVTPPTPAPIVAAPAAIVAATTIPNGSGALGANGINGLNGATQPATGRADIFRAAMA